MRRIPLTQIDVRIFGQILLKPAISRVLIILPQIISYYFSSFTSFHRIYRKSFFFYIFFLFCFFCFCFQNSLSTGYSYLPYLFWLGRLLCYPHRTFFLVLPCLVYLLLRTLFLFTLVQSFRKLKLSKRLLVNCLYCKVTKLLRRKNCKIVYSGKVIC